MIFNVGDLVEFKMLGSDHPYDGSIVLVNSSKQGRTEIDFIIPSQKIINAGIWEYTPKRIVVNTYNLIPLPQIDVGDLEDDF